MPAGVTTLYFEAEREDDLPVDRAGFPLQVGCWQANKAETTTIIPIVEAFQAAHGIAELVIVAGRRHALSRQPDGPGRRPAAVHRLGPAPPGPQATWRLTSTGTGTPPPTARSSTPSPPSGARGVSGTRAARQSRCGTRTPTRAHGGPSGSTPGSERPGTTRPSQLRPIAPGPSVSGEKRPKGTRFVTVHQGEQVLDEASIARARSLVGLKGYVTNIPSRLMGAGDVISSYHELWHARAVLRR